MPGFFRFESLSLRSYNVGMNAKKEVRQRNKSDCCIAAVANAIGISYAEVKRVCGSSRGGLADHELKWLIGEFSDWRETVPRRVLSIDEWLRRHRSGRYVLVLYVYYGESHAIACVDGQLMGHYSTEWPIVQYFTLLDDAA
jgi:hypothetical protein